MSGEFEKIDKKEERRIDNLAKSFESGEEIMIADILGSKSILKLLEDKPLAFWNSFRDANPMLPLNCLLFPRTLVEICPGCDCNANPELIRPYLERKLILPLLSYPIAEYSSEFCELTTQYPYVSVQSLLFLRFATCMHEESREIGVMCPHCFNEYCARILKKMSKKYGDKKMIVELKGYLQDTLFPQLLYPRRQEVEILEQIEDAVNQGNLELMEPLSNRANFLDTFRTAQIFEATPQVAHEDLTNIIEILDKMKISVASDVVDEIEKRAWAIKALNLDYAPAMPVENYLDIIVPRRKKINSMVNELVLGGGEPRHLSKLNDEIWRINEEISSSKSIETMTFLTNFVFSNAKILFSMLAGALIGYSSASFVGCGLGSIGGLVGGIAGKLTSKYKPFEIPEYPRKTMEWIKAKIESPEERLLSLILAKDIKIIQTWTLRRKLKRK